jgi:hypothetical protein
MMVNSSPTTRPRCSDAQKRASLLRHAECQDDCASPYIKSEIALSALESPTAVFPRHEWQVFIPHLRIGDFLGQQDRLLIGVITLDVAPAETQQPLDFFGFRAQGDGGQKGVFCPIQLGRRAQVVAWRIEPLWQVAE